MSLKDFIERRIFFTKWLGYVQRNPVPVLLKRGSILTKFHMGYHLSFQMRPIATYNNEFQIFRNQQHEWFWKDFTVLCDYLFLGKMSPYMLLFDSYTFENFEKYFQNWQILPDSSQKLMILTTKSYPTWLFHPTQLFFNWKLSSLHVYSILHNYSIAKSRLWPGLCRPCPARAIYYCG